MNERLDSDSVLLVRRRQLEQGVVCTHFIWNIQSHGGHVTQSQICIQAALGFEIRTYK